MVISVPNQDYIDSLIQSIHRQALNHDRLCQLLFAVIDQFCACLPVTKRRGRKRTYPDSTLLKLDMLMPLTGKRGETEMLREIERPYATAFVQCPKQPRLWHRIRQALPLIEPFRRPLRALLGCDEEDLEFWMRCPFRSPSRLRALGVGMAWIGPKAVSVPAKNSKTWVSNSVG